MFRNFFAVFDAPATFIKEKIVQPNQQVYPWYHQKFRRVPTIDQCYMDDPICYFEADMQYRRDRMVDSEILSILRQRFEDCVVYEAPDHVERCKGILDQYIEGTTNWFTKYGDLGAYHNVRTAYMKQKHRIAWENKYGPVGSGMKEQ
ncbi:hypothetical protein FQR65_LT14291 [Abscondita terminalis]|nr:hypothetical protein FQR65_LT14291 [Abscondita terminalis]